MIAPNDEGAFLRRGLAVSVYSLLEQFIQDRIMELIQYVNTGVIQYSHFPTDTQVRMLKRTLAVANARLKYVDDSEVLAYLSELGTSLVVASPTRFSPHAWSWAGANMLADDYKTALKWFNVQDAFRHVRELSGRLGFAVIDAATGSEVELGAVLHEFASQRNEAAHNATHQVTSLWLRGIGDTATRFAICFDALASASAQALRSSDSDYLSNKAWGDSRRIKLRSIVERASGHYAEMTETSGRAVRISSDLEQLLSAASGRCGPYELLARFDRSGRVLGWYFPSVG